jgi:hypothetical protein
MRAPAVPGRLGRGGGRRAPATRHHHSLRSGQVRGPGARLSRPGRRCPRGFCGGGGGMEFRPGTAAKVSRSARGLEDPFRAGPLEVAVWSRIARWRRKCHPVGVPQKQSRVSTVPPRVGEPPPCNSP